MPGRPSPLFLLSGMGMMAVAVAAVAWLRPGRGGLWKAIGMGALAWAISVALKATWAVLTNALVNRGLLYEFGARIGPPIFWCYIGLLTGIFECGFVLIFTRLTSLRRAGWSQTIAFGVGFGAIEALLLGLASFASLLALIVFFDHMPIAARGQALKVIQAVGPALIPFPIIERAAAVVLHVFSCALIIFAVQARQMRWFWLSFFYKSAIDAVAAWAQLTGVVHSLRGIALVEVIVCVFAVLGLIGLRWLRPRFAELKQAQPGADLADELPAPDFPSE